ncbi:MAG: 1-deoxy-D-xylulose-5-phosphate synthase [Firmicutes bacterium]|nr:1-deoxy-D-xylulose-5-phosphate synthase [candidate division NPL-UPA2 bacterium]
MPIEEGTELLERINHPRDLRELTARELEILAQEIRELIISVVAKNGGHLASNLGVVELTLALHREFEAEQDQIVWDVGHQTYAHKILTGRRERFSSLRQEGGLSGFPKREESPCDAFNTGHATTSISAALGLAEAMRQSGSRSHVVAVIGDGALTGGMAWEAINHAAHLARPLIVILNDNEMSISTNVGAIARYLNTLRTTRLYRQTKQDVQGVLKGIGSLGDSIWRWATRLKDSLKYLLVGGMVFEEMGFTYLGPVDGHSIPELTAVLRQAKQLAEPVLIHCLTEKGRGYLPALRQPDQYHSASPFMVETGERIEGDVCRRTFTQVFGESLVSLAEQDDKLVAITAAMLDATGLKDFARCFPKRIYDVGIAEAHMMTFAAGLAAGGLKPVVAVYSTFMQRAYDQALHDVCLQKLPVVVCLDRAGVVGEDGETHHGLYDLSYLRTLPNMTILAPSGEQDMLPLLEKALCLGAPVALRYPRDCARDLPKQLPVHGTLLIDEKPDCLLVGIGPLFLECYQAASRLKRQGVRAGVWYCPKVWPLEDELLRLVMRVKLVVTAEDNILAGGFGASLAEGMPAGNTRLVRLGFADGCVAHAHRNVLLSRAGLTAEGIVAAVIHALQ